MDYTFYEPEDFAANESYLRYYFKLDPVDVFFWQNWISNHPEKLDVIMSADQLISFAALHLPEEEYQQELERMQRAVAAGNTLQEEPPLIATRQGRLVRLFAVAGITIGVLLTTVLVLYNMEYYRSRHTQQLAAQYLREKKNEGAQPMKIQLEDSSFVTLEAGSRLLYPPHFTGGKREVYLEGNAFFDVSHDADRPFYVYYNNLVTHVLGTSFQIRTNPRKQVEVTVRSGKVEVYEKKAVPHKQDHAAVSNGVILTPNQKVTYSEDSRQFEASLVEDPLPLAPVVKAHSIRANDAPVADNSHSFVFNTAPLPDVLHTFEEVYGIEIEVENERINNCHFSGDISNMDFNARMEVICQVLHVAYEVRGTKIIIRGTGCPA
jgi:ferric-dicitrate binding protein FerR (iron transport regulator)